MDNVQIKNRTFEGLAWGTFFIWWGMTDLFQILPKGTGLLGFGLILIGLNAARSVSGIPTGGFTITLGILALVLGGLELAGTVLSLPFELPVFAILLLVLGVVVLARGTLEFGKA